MLPCITDVSRDDLPDLLESMGLKKYAAVQLLGWLYKSGAESFDEMSNMSRSAREMFGQRFAISAVQLKNEISAADGTRKFLFGLKDGLNVETVLIPAEDGRSTICVSTQVGCKLGCAFCRTGEMGFRRNLTQGEILGQVIEARRATTNPITNVVFMGMGEPLLNPDAVSRAIEILLDEKAFGLSKRRITVSTAGIIPELEKLIGHVDVKVAISLNATTDEQRNSIMPINKRYPLSDIVKFCREYSETSKHRVTFEYVLIGGFNDTMDDAKRLVKLLSGFRAKINLIPFNPFPGTPLNAPNPKTLDLWRDYLVEKGVQVNVRVSRGAEILAACGQLAEHSSRQQAQTSTCATR